MKIDQTIDAEKFKNLLFFRLKLSSWGNRRQGDIRQVKTSDDAEQDAKTKERLNISKMLVKCPELAAILRAQTELKNWCLSRSMPSFIDEGLFCVKPSETTQFEAKLNFESKRITNELMPELVRVFPAAVVQARRDLNGQFDLRDYPGMAQTSDGRLTLEFPDQLTTKFAIAWRWIAFAVPEGLPPEIREAEIAKMQASMNEASDSILNALRVGFQELIAHATERLTPAGPGEKKKIFRDSLIGNLAEFCETFNARNLMNDAELAALVAQAQTILTNADPNTLRDSAKARANIRTQFTAIKEKLDGMITTAPVRKFNLDEE